MFEVQGQHRAPVRRTFLAGRTAGDAVTQERQETRELLAKHGRVMALCALRGSRSSTFGDYMVMRGAMLAGGVHRLRKRSRRDSLELAGGSGIAGASCRGVAES